MEIDANNSVAIHHFLTLAEDMGWNWVAFDLPRGGQIDNLHGFESASEAVTFCESGNTNFDVYEQNFVEANYQYMAIRTLQQAMEPALQNTSSLVSTETLLTQMIVQDISLLRSQDKETLLPAIRSGAIFPVQYDRQIDPEKEVDRFSIVAHHHAGHQVYEIGHSIQVLDTFPELDKAEKYFRNVIRQYHDNTDGNDYQLIGLYRGRDYKYDLDGSPESYSGFTVKTAFYQYEPGLGAKTWRVETWNDIGQPQNIRHFLYAAYDAESRRFKLWDDRLQKVRPKDIKVSTYPSHFINEKLTIKKLKIMNEQSYEYVQNQLFYMGFGNELNQPLRDKMERNLAEFTLEFSKDFGKDSTKSVLHFSKGDDLKKDMTFFNRLEMTLKKEGLEDLTQTFFIGKNYNYTLQERYNMLDGRAVYREQPKMEPVEENGQIRMKPTGETYFAWKRLDFKEADSYGNFVPKTMFWNHEKELMKYPIKNIEENYDRSRLLPALQRGDKVPVILVRDGVETPARLVVNPRMTRLDFYDANGQSLIVRKVEKQAVSQTETVELTPQQVQQAAIAKAAAQNQQPQQTNGVKETQQTGQQQSQQNEAKKEGAAEEQKTDHTQRRKQGVHI
jgi:hypothetical protein